MLELGCSTTLILIFCLTSNIFLLGTVCKRIGCDGTTYVALLILVFAVYIAFAFIEACFYTKNPNKQQEVKTNENNDIKIQMKEGFAANNP